MGILTKFVAHTAVESARELAKAEIVEKRDNAQWWWFSRGLIALVLVVGWIFILWQNKFHLDVPAVVICLGYLAVVLALANLWRLGAATVEPQADGDDGWARPIGHRGELEREKKTLLKSIKEAEFDREMGKLSKVDADELIGMYRARAIEVIKELDRMDAAGKAVTETPREAIEREVAARVAIEQEQAKAKKKKKGKGAATASAATDPETRRGAEKAEAAEIASTTTTPVPEKRREAENAEAAENESSDVASSDDASTEASNASDAKTAAAADDSDLNDDADADDTDADDSDAPAPAAAKDDSSKEVSS